MSDKRKPAAKPDLTMANVTRRLRADGLLLARPDESGRIADLTVFLRPLGALQALADEMGRRLGGPMSASA